MKKILLSMVSIATLALATGCSKDQTTDNPISKQGTLRASTEQQTRTALDGVNVVWSADDKIAAINTGNASVVEPYTLTSGASTTNGEFGGNPLTGEGDIYALYPCTSVQFADGKLHFTISDYRTFSESSFAFDALPMVGKSTAAVGNLSFKNLMGVVLFQTIGEGETVASLQVTTAGEKIAGPASVAMDYTDTPVLTMEDEGRDCILLSNVNKTLSATPTKFYIALPAGTYGAGMTFAFLDDEGSTIWSITTTKPLIVNRSKLAPLATVSRPIRDFPDANFRNCLGRLGLISTSDGQDIDINDPTNIEKFETITEIICPNDMITSLKGIEYFKALTTLRCSYNQLTTLDVSKNRALTELFCSDNQLETLDVSKNTLLTHLYCNRNQLKALDVSKNTQLDRLGCTENQLTAFDVSKNTQLKTLDCGSNKLETLDVSENTLLTNLDCYNNRMSVLDICSNTQLAKETLFCGAQTTNGTTTQWLTLLMTQAQYDAKLGTGGYNDNVTPTVKVPNFPDAEFRKVLTASKYGLVLTTDGTDIDITNANNIEKLKTITNISCNLKYILSLKGIEFFTALTSLRCSDNLLTALDISKNTKLTELNCYNNPLETTLDVSKNTELQLLNCYNNQLETLDVSKNTALTYLNCTGNQLGTLDVSKNTALTYLNCTGNQLGTLDVSKNTKLEIIYLNTNQLETLDVSNNTELQLLNCSNNQLKTLDVSKNTALTSLYCYDNRLSELDISSCQQLDKIYLECGLQTSDGNTAQNLTLWCTQPQINDGLGTGGNNDNVIPTVKP